MSRNDSDAGGAIFSLAILCALIFVAIVIVLGPWITVFSESGGAGRTLLIASVPVRDDLDWGCKHRFHQCLYR